MVVFPPDISRLGLKLAALGAAVVAFGSCSYGRYLDNWESSDFLPGVGWAVLRVLASLVIVYLLLPRLLIRFPQFRATGIDDPLVAKNPGRSLVKVTAVTWTAIVGIAAFAIQRPGTSVMDDAIPMALFGGLFGLIYGIVAAAIIRVLQVATRSR